MAWWGGRLAASCSSKRGRRNPDTIRRGANFPLNPSGGRYARGHSVDGLEHRLRGYRRRDRVAHGEVGGGAVASGKHPQLYRARLGCPFPWLVGCSPRRWYHAARMRRDFRGYGQVGCAVPSRRPGALRCNCSSGQKFEPYAPRKIASFRLRGFSDMTGLAGGYAKAALCRDERSLCLDRPAAQDDRCYFELSKPQIFTRELIDCCAPHQLHSPLDLCPHEAKGPLNTGLTGRRERIEIEASDSNGFGPKRKCL
jgi:hypothetical protein